MLVNLDNMHSNIYPKTFKDKSSGKHFSNTKLPNPTKDLRSQWKQNFKYNPIERIVSDMETLTRHQKI